MLHFWAVLLCSTCIRGIRTEPFTQEKVWRKGLNFKGLESRITHGHEAEMEQFPWQVDITIEKKYYRIKFTHCGGSLINDRWILTAAHCLARNTRRVRVCFGTRTTRIGDCSRNKFSYPDFFMHPEYDVESNLYDIALMKLPNPVKFNENIQPIELINEELPPFSKVIASGWGTTYNADESEDLLFANMITFPNEVCKIYTTSNTSEKLCAASEGVLRESICEGDRGGPLVYYNAIGTPFLAGITSHGSRTIPVCDCGSNLPVFFADIYKVRTWILENI